MATIEHRWNELLTAWLGWLTLRGLSPETIRLRGEHMRFVAYYSHTTAPDELTEDGIRALFADREWSPAYRKSMRESVCSFYGWAVRSGALTADVSAALPAVRPITPRPRPAPDHVWAHLVAHAGPRELLMARLAAEAGLRRAEVAKVHADDLCADDLGWSLIVHGKGDKQRVVPINDDLGADISALPRGWVFPSRKGGHMSEREVGRLVSRLMPEGWSMHKLRHRYATRGYAATRNLRAVQLALGHASVATTERYTAVTTPEVRAVSEAAARKEAS